jgi:hypothetical protein
MNCLTCKKPLDVEGDDLSNNCGGDCAECMARAGDPDELKGVIDALVGRAFEIGFDHGIAPYRPDDAKLANEAWGPVAEKLFEIVREAGHIQPTSETIIAELSAAAAVAVDVTKQVEVGLPDGELLPLTKCVCGAEFGLWEFTINAYQDNPNQCPKCGRLMYFRNDLRVYEAPLR